MQAAVLVGSARIWTASSRRRSPDHDRHPDRLCSSVHGSSMRRTAAAATGDTTRTNSWGPGEPLRFFVEVEHSTVTSLVKLGFIPPHQARDLGTILAALNRVGVKPSFPAAPDGPRPTPASRVRAFWTQPCANSLPPGSENDVKPADGVPVESPEPLPICVGRQICGRPHLLRSRSGCKPNSRAISAHSPE